MSLLCQAMDVSRAAYYEWLDTKPGKREVENEALRQDVAKAFETYKGIYGRRRLARVVTLEGQGVSANSIERRMKELSLAGWRPKAFKKTTTGDPSLANSPNLLKRENITANRPDQVWVTDITYVATKDGWLYLCVFMDLYSRKVLGWAMDENMKTELVIKAFEMACKSRKPAAGLIVHSDCGGQYKSKKFRRALSRRHVRQSMTHAGNCYDNAHAESFFGTLKNELIRGVKFQTREEAKAALFEYVEVFYNRIRLHSSIGYQSPEDFENVA